MESTKEKAKLHFELQSCSSDCNSAFLYLWTIEIEELYGILIETLTIVKEKWLYECTKEIYDRDGT